MYEGCNALHRVSVSTLARLLLHVIPLGKDEGSNFPLLLRITWMSEYEPNSKCSVRAG